MTVLKSGDLLLPNAEFIADVKSFRRLRLESRVWNSDFSNVTIRVGRVATDFGSIKMTNTENQSLTLLGFRVSLMQEMREAYIKANGDKDAT